MTISALMLVNLKGETIIARHYRDDIRKSTADAFRAKVIEPKNFGPPIVHIDNASFLYVRQGDVYVVAISKLNCNTSLVFQYIYKLIDVYSAYFGGVFDEESVKNNYCVIYELMDEMMDYGYPQITSLEVLTPVIQVASLRDEKSKGNIAPVNTNMMTGEITGKVDWRQADKYRYRKNEVFIDVLEAVNLMMSSKGTLLRADVSGKIIMKTYLTGMPECKFGMNDKLTMEKETKSANTPARRRPGVGIAIDDVTFHRCVKLSQFDHDRTINFVPPDGEFELMKYRITSNINTPFRVIPQVTELGRNRVEYEIQIRANFSDKLIASNVLIQVPTPPNTAKCKMSVGIGKAKYNPSGNFMLWKIKKFPGDSAYVMKGEVKLIAGIDDKPWSRPPIEMQFNVPMFASSGLHVRFMKVFERSNYDTIKWVRYMTRAGQYQIRI